MRILYILENKKQAVKIFPRRTADLANSDPDLNSVIQNLEPETRRCKIQKQT